MSIFKKVMGNRFQQLHPALQKRYDLTDGMTFKATGIMREIKGGPRWLYPLFHLGVNWKLLFPERGKSIPFTIKNSAYIDNNGEKFVHWERIFHFGDKRRYFNALMSLDEKRLVIKDYLGEPALVYSDLAFYVTAEGHLTIISLNQRLVLGKLEIPIPKVLQGLAVVTEKYSESKQVYEISVTVKNKLIGTIFSYEGVFTVDENA